MINKLRKLNGLELKYQIPDRILFPEVKQYIKSHTMGQSKRSWQDVIDKEKLKYSAVIENVKYKFFVSKGNNGHSLIARLLKSRP